MKMRASDIGINIEPVHEELSAEVTMDVCEFHSKKLDFGTFFRGTGAFHDHYSGEAWKKEKVVEAVRNDFHEMDSFSVMQWRRRSENPVGETVISTELFAKLKDEGAVRSRMVAGKFAEGQPKTLCDARHRHRVLPR